MPHAYTKDQLVEQPAIGLFAEQSASPNLHPRPFSHWEKGGRPAGLRVRSLVVLVGRLRAAWEKLDATRLGHDALPPEAIDAAIDELTRDLLLPRLLSGQVELATAGETGHRAAKQKPSLVSWA